MSIPMWYHWVARASTPFQPFSEFELARFSWIRLRELFPEMLALVLMPNHLHLILPQTQQSRSDLSRLTGFLSSVSRRKDIQNLWQAIPPPSTIPDRQYLCRTLRYVALNPCRKGLCSDPLQWYWSTYRDILGASVNPGQGIQNLARSLGESRAHFEVRFHAYVSGDPSVRVAGTPLPKAAIPPKWAENSVGVILAAAAASVRSRPEDVKIQHKLRFLFIHLAYRHGWRQPALLSQICGITPRAVHKVLSKPPPDFRAAELCLGDERLRWWLRSS